MRFIFSIQLMILVLSSCKNELQTISEDFQAICLVSNGAEIELENGVYMSPPTIHYVLFLYHDTIFQVSIGQKKSVYSYLKTRNHGKDSLESLMKEYNGTSLKKQVQLMKKMHSNLSSDCGPLGYFLFRKNYNLNFGIFPYREYTDWNRKYVYKEIPLTINQLPKIYSTIYHTLNSKQWDYFMSNDYYYKDVRTYRKNQFLFERRADSKR
ncbi:hypothetical protein [Fluviicola chungangensis]|uniref:Lipoprotein n=1 Tax=Fluviicola chungangensis TaxID=2597671 RepID=A0A556MR27_9FLAO|nr:hypothetical protein [Fluviicola chungangensis]TSJ42335.1 hypothetical protein FO442_11240 [Fluviicola chungangensis]